MTVEEKDAEHREWLKSLPALGYDAGAVERSLWLWEQMKGLFGSQSKVPAAVATEGCIGHHWRTDELDFCVEVHNDGHYELYLWDRTKQRVVGAVDTSEGETTC